jgi:Spy/CpxP family protein refolding chaperone
MRRIPVHFRRLAVPVVLALVFSPALAQFGHGPHHGQFRGQDGAMHHRIFERLDLTDAQGELIERLMTEHRESIRPQVEQERTRRQEIMDLVHAEDVDETLIRTAVMEAAAVHADIAVERARLMQQIRLLLTPEQREKADEMFQRRREFMEEGGPGFRGGHRSHGPGPHGPRRHIDD